VSSAPEGADLRRVSVVGTSGCGKTRFAHELAPLLRAAHVELDALHWQQGWVARPPEELRALVQRSAAAERWLIDGNYAVVRDLVWARATCVVWLNYGFPVVFARALSRTLRRSLTREELFSGNRESLRKAFLSRDSILLWVLQTFRSNRIGYDALRRDPAWQKLEFVELRSPAEADAFLARVREQRAGA